MPTSSGWIPRLNTKVKSTSPGFERHGIRRDGQDAEQQCRSAYQFRNHVRERPPNGRTGREDSEFEIGIRRYLPVREINEPDEDCPLRTHQSVAPRCKGGRQPTKLPIAASPIVTAGLRWAPSQSSDRIDRHRHRDPQPTVMTIQPLF